MAKVDIGKGRTTINELPHGIEVIIPAKKNYFIILFLAFWMIGWFFGEVSAINTLLDSDSKAPKLFMLAWLGGWSVGGAFAIFIWLWNVKGKEIVRINGIELQHKRDFVLFSRSKEYEIANIKDLRANPQNTSMFGFNNGMEFWGFSGGAVAFDYGHSTHKFGSGLDEAEAKHIVQTIRNRYQSL
jgi:hypothetical protein